MIRHADERVAAAAEVAHGGSVRLVLTGRAENHIHGVQGPGRHHRPSPALPGGWRRCALRSGRDRGADLRLLISEVDRPVNVVARPGCPPVAELAEAGVRRCLCRIVVTYAAVGALVERRRPNSATTGRSVTSTELASAFGQLFRPSTGTDHTSPETHRRHRCARTRLR